MRPGTRFLAAQILHLTVIVTVALLGNVSVPPGPNVMLPVDWNTVP